MRNETPREKLLADCDHMIEQCLQLARSIAAYAPGNPIAEAAARDLESQGEEWRARKALIEAQGPDVTFWQ